MGRAATALPLLALSIATPAGCVAADEPLPVLSVCQVLQNIDLYKDRVIRVRAMARLSDHWPILFEPYECEFEITWMGWRELGIDAASNEAARASFLAYLKAIAAAWRQGYRGRAVSTIEGRLEVRISRYGQIWYTIRGRHLGVVFPDRPPVTPSSRENVTFPTATAPYR